METVEELAEGLAAAQLALQGSVEAIAADRYGNGPGPDQWSPAQIVAHAIELQPFWARQILGLLAEAHPTIGRVTEEQRQERLAAVERGAHLAQAQAIMELRRAAHEALEQVRALSPDQLSRQGTLVTLDTGKGEPRTIAQLIETVLIRHLREHAEELQRLGGA